MSLPRQGDLTLALQYRRMAANGKLKLYNADWCWYCRRVRRKLDELGLDYDCIEVPIRHSQRQEVMQVSGQSSVPVLVDGATVLDDDDVIIPYLEEKYGHAKTGGS